MEISILCGASPVLMTSTIVLLCAYRFAYLIPNTILSDVPDLKGDGSAGVRTPASILAMKPMIAAVICAIIGTVGLGAALVGTGMSFVLILVDLAGMLLFLPFLVVDDITPRMKFLLDSALLWPMVLFLIA